MGTMNMLGLAKRTKVGVAHVDGKASMRPAPAAAASCHVLAVILICVTACLRLQTIVYEHAKRSCRRASC